MFKANPTDMRMEPTPERVLSVCRLVAYESLPLKEIVERMTLGSNKSEEINHSTKSLNVALEELGLLKKVNDRLVLAVDPKIISSATSFRRYVSSRVFFQKDSSFFKFTKWAIGKNEELFELKSWESMAKTCGSELGDMSTIGENAVLGWRFWAAFLGIGYLSGTMIIPNMKLRLQDILATDFNRSFSYDTSVRATDFIAWLSTQMPEVEIGAKLPLALSAGLRTLHELEFINLSTWRDSNKILLYPVDGDPLIDFSHIIVKEAVKE